MQTVSVEFHGASTEDYRVEPNIANKFQLMVTFVTNTKPTLRTAQSQSINAIPKHATIYER